jgi:hypothetical protein
VGWHADRLGTSFVFAVDCRSGIAAVELAARTFRSPVGNVLLPAGLVESPARAARPAGRIPVDRGRLGLPVLPVTILVERTVKITVGFTATTMVVTSCAAATPTSNALLPGVHDITNATDAAVVVVAPFRSRPHAWSQEEPAMGIIGDVLVTPPAEDAVAEPGKGLRTLEMDHSSVAETHTSDADTTEAGITDLAVPCECMQRHSYARPAVTRGNGHMPDVAPGSLSVPGDTVDPPFAVHRYTAAPPETVESAA